MIHRPPLLRVLLALLLMMLNACAIGPTYVRPDVEVPAAYKEQSGWKRAPPNDTNVGGAWWQAYADPLLDSLMVRVSISNQTLAHGDHRLAPELIGLLQFCHRGLVLRRHPGEGVTGTDHMRYDSFGW